MPELPDVETFKRYLDATSLHQRINNVDVRSAYVLKGISGTELSRKLKGRRFESSQRHGKHLLVRIDGQVWLRLDFGMTGFLSYLKDAEKTSPHARVIFVFANGYRLAFDDQRKFGEVGLVEDVDAFLKKRQLGPDAFDVDLAQFKKMLAKYRSSVKPALMNQRLIAGIGNIYADEILFRARVHPATRISALEEKVIATLFRAMRYVLEKAIASQAEAARMPKSWLLLHRRKGGRCPRCGCELQSSSIGGRTAWFCAHCQRHAS